MKITLVMVTSADGKITKDGLGPSFWASKEDQEFFKEMKKKVGVLIMGRKTYEAAGKPQGDGIERIIMSHKGPTAREIVSRGYKEALLVGGSEINTLFFKEKLIDEIYLTIEPMFFGHGLNIASEALQNVNLELIDIKRLNEQGTILLHYKVK